MAPKLYASLVTQNQLWNRQKIVCPSKTSQNVKQNKRVENQNRQPKTGNQTC